MNENYEMLVEEIKGGLEQLATLDPSDQGYMENVRSLEVLWKLKLEEDKIALNRDVNASSSNQAKINSDNEKKKLEIEEKKLEVKKSEDEFEKKKFDEEMQFKRMSINKNVEIEQQKIELDKDKHNQNIVEFHSEDTHRTNSEIIENNKLEVEKQKINLKKSEDVTEENRAKRESIERYVSMGINVLSIVVPIAFYGKWLKTGMQFEETGTFTSKTFQGLTKFFRPTK